MADEVAREHEELLAVDRAALFHLWHRRYRDRVGDVDVAAGLDLPPRR